MVFTDDLCNVGSQKQKVQMSAAAVREMSCLPTFFLGKALFSKSEWYLTPSCLVDTKQVLSLNVKATLEPVCIRHCRYVISSMHTLIKIETGLIRERNLFKNSRLSANLSIAQSFSFGPFGRSICFSSCSSQILYVIRS